MRVIKLYTLLAFLAIALVSCETATKEKVVFYSKDDLKNELPINIDNTDGALVSINSKAVIGFHSSEFFNNNLVYLRDVSVPKMCFKVKNFDTNSANVISNIQVYVDDIRITDYMGTDFLDPSNNDVQFEINNGVLLSAIATKLMQNRQVTISYYSDAVTSNQIGFEFEFSITAQGTFVD